MSEFLCYTNNNQPINGFKFLDTGIVKGYYDPNPQDSQYGFNPTEQTLYSLSLECCNSINQTYDENLGECYWRELDDTSFKLLFDSNNNNGSLFQVDENEDCILEIKFDFMLQMECSNFLNCYNDCINEDIDPNTCINDIFNNFNAFLTLETFSGGTQETVYREQIYEYTNLNDLVNLSNSGIRMVDSNGNCGEVDNIIKEALGENCDLYNENTLDGKWLNINALITNTGIIEQIKNKEIKFGIEFNACTCKFSALVDNIELNRICTTTDTNETVVNACPGFILKKEVDNKKSWVKETDLDEREYNFPRRHTDYDTNHHKLVLNTKEIDLDLDPSSAIETDVMCYIQSNECILECSSGTTVATIPTTNLNLEEMVVFFGSGCSFTETIENGCPSGYNLNDDGLCEQILTTAATFNGELFTAYTGNINSVYGQSGTQFYSLTTLDSYSIPYYRTNFSQVKDNNGNIIPWDNINNNSIWKQRLNQSGIWATPSSSNNEPYHEWIGFSYCINIPEGEDGIYSLGLGADNRCRFTINSELIYESNLGDDTGPGAGCGGSANGSFTYWRVFEIELFEGDNIIEFEGYNCSSQAAFGFEIYNTTVDVLDTITNKSVLENDYILFSTKDLRYETNGNVAFTFDLGENSGYACPSGYALDSCNNGNCIKKDITNPLPDEVVEITCSGTSACDYNTRWELTLYEGDCFDNETLLYSGGTFLEIEGGVPSQEQYENELIKAANSIGYNYLVKNDEFSFLKPIGCEDDGDKTIIADLSFEIYGCVSDTKQFQDEICFNFQDGERYNFE